MKKTKQRASVLGIEGGGTKTEWVYLQRQHEQMRVLKQGQLPGANFRLISRGDLRRLLRFLPRKASHVGVFLAGCVTESDRKELFELCRQVWPDSHIAVGSDRESGFAAAFGESDGIAVMSGTGSAVTGRKNKRIENAGGRGHLLGDRGGAYVISIEGLRLVLRDYDLEHRITPLAENILRALSLNRMEDLIGWTQSADKKDISALAPVMFDAAENGDLKMLSVIQAGANALAQYTESVARWLEYVLPDVRLLGGLFLNHPMYVELYRDKLEAQIKVNSLELCHTTGAIGAAYLATSKGFEPTRIQISAKSSTDKILATAITEAPNPRSQKLNRLNISELVGLFINEEKHVQQALDRSRKSLEKAIRILETTFQNGGRLFYVGAGTSGRLGILDASEIPPTFGESPDRVQAIIAGGPGAITQSVEAAEDDSLQGAAAILERGVKKTDVVCGITASGRTPFVVSALQRAKKLGARTILITCNPEAICRCDLKIELATGPELIAGSTRLKCGTATKITLNILTTCTMIRLGKVYGNQMANLKVTNFKLKDRAIRLVSQIKGWPSHKAEMQLEQNNWNIRAVLDL